MEKHLSKSPKTLEIAAAATALVAAGTVAQLDGAGAITAVVATEAVAQLDATDATATDAADAAADTAMAAAAPQLAAMTLEEAAALVRRRTVLQAPGAQDRVIERAIAPAEVLAFKDHGTHVVVVTVDGQKFSTAAAA